MTSYKYREYCHEDSGKGWPQYISVIISHEDFNFLRQNLESLHTEESKKRENTFMTTSSLVAKLRQTSTSTVLKIRGICRQINCIGSNSYKIWIKSMFIWDEKLIWALQINKSILLNSNSRFISSWSPNSCHVSQWLGIQDQQGLQEQIKMRQVSKWHLLANHKQPYSLPTTINRG